MISNYIKTVIRTIRKNILYSLLNIFGLAIGMATVLLILLYVFEEYSYDNFHQHPERIFRVVQLQQYTGQPSLHVALTPGPLAPSLTNFPEIEASTRVNYNQHFFEKSGDKLQFQGIDTDPSFFEIFSFEIVAGDKRTCLNQLNSIVISKTLATKLFANEDAIGKVVTIDMNRQFSVTAVVNDAPENSHLKFDYVLPYESLYKQIPAVLDRWDNNTLYTYIRIKEGTVLDQINIKIKSLLTEHLKEGKSDLSIQPLQSIHLDPTTYIADNAAKGNKNYVFIFTVIAMFILVIACINFVNLTTATAIRRSKEVGLRKAIGALRTQLVAQFLSESLILSLISITIASAFVYLFLPYYNVLIAKNISFNSSSVTPSIFICLCLSVITGLLAGFYPAIFLSSFDPARLVKGDTTGQRRGKKFRQSLVVFQFAISIIMISSTIVVFLQLQFIRQSDTGYQKEDIINIHGVSEQYEVFKQAMSKIPGVEAVTATNQHPSQVIYSSNDLVWRGKEDDKPVLFHNQDVDYDYIETMKMKVSQGRAFSKDFPSDSSAVMINEEAARIMGFENPIGEKVKSGQFDYTIIGVVKNFNFKSIHDKIEPIVIYWNKPFVFSNMLIRLDGHSSQRAIEMISVEWTKLNPGRALEYTFLEEDLNQIYQSEVRTSILFKYFAGLAIFISSLGLFTLASFNVEQRSKEFGIRKIMGASNNILFLISIKEFMALVAISFVIAAPISWFWMNNWLDTFAYRISLPLFVFLVSGVLAVVITLFTISYHSIRLAKIEPIKVLKNIE